jgi:hypothetical protein
MCLSLGRIENMEEGDIVPLEEGDIVPFKADFMYSYFS